MLQNATRSVLQGLDEYGEEKDDRREHQETCDYECPADPPRDGVPEAAIEARVKSRWWVLRLPSSPLGQATHAGSLRRLPPSARSVV
jgi:hypothetical protein